MNKYLLKTILGLTILVGIFGITHLADASIISANPQDKVFATGETFLVEIHLNSEKEIINAVEATITYPTNLLEVVKISKGGSFLSLWAQLRI